MTQDAFSLHTDFLQDPCRGLVVDVAGCRDAVQIEIGEGEAQQLACSFRGVAAAPDVSMEAVTEECLPMGSVHRETGSTHKTRCFHIDDGQFKARPRCNATGRYIAIDEGATVHFTVGALGHKKDNLRIGVVFVYGVPILFDEVTQKQTLRR
jgi:hypothetical protein